MAFPVTLFLITLVNVCVIAENAQNAFVKVVCKPQNVGQYGQQSLLECVVQTTHEVADAEIRTVSWRKEGVEKPLLVFYKGKVMQQPGYRMAQPSWNKKDMNVSLLIANATLADGGDYSCTVITNSGDGEFQTSLKVTAKYGKPVVHSIPEKITGNADAALVCDVDGGYPEGRIRWFVEGNTDWTKSSKLEARKAQGGLFHLSSTLTLSRGSIFSKYTCVVFNATGGKEAETIFNLDDLPASEELGSNGLDAASKIIAPVVVIGSLIVGLLLLLVFRCRKRSREARRQSTTPLMSPHQGDNRFEPGVEEGLTQEMDTSQKSS
uniref:CD276 antigen homolog isoform X2 n=1 Tax=Solea senegalensis TaxID=28829 RepID=UPI001CD885D5|nr:CD276 antigen homolog isoform X2 [Solea senegalensis]